MKKFLVVMAGVALLALPSLANAQGRPLRLFFSTNGLSDPADVQSNAEVPASLGVNPTVDAMPGETVRLYVWAQITPPGPANNATYNGVSLAVNAGGGSAVTGFNFWNYTNGALGNGAGRWQQFGVVPSLPGSVEFSGGAVVAGIGVTNSGDANTNDRQHRRFAADGTTRIDSTLLGYVELSAAAAGDYPIHFAIGSLGIAQQGQPPQPIYMGWGDEQAAPLGNQFGGTTPNADATLHVFVPEPASMILLALAGLAAFRRR